MDWFMIGQKQQAAFTDEAHCKLPSTNNQFLTLSWFAKGFIFVHINLKPQNISLLLLVKLLLLLFFFRRSWSKCPGWQLLLLREVQLDGPQTKLLDFKKLE